MSGCFFFWNTVYTNLPAVMDHYRLAVALPGFAARRGKDWNYVMGHSRWTSGPGAAAAGSLIVLWLLQNWWKELWVVDICISWSRRLHNTLLVGSQIWKPRHGGHVPQCLKLATPLSTGTVARNGQEVQNVATQRSRDAWPIELYTQTDYSERENKESGCLSWERSTATLGTTLKRTHVA